MSEPIYLRQFGLEELQKNPRFVEVVVIPNARAKGVTFARLSWREDLRIVLYEGWSERPEDQGEIRWLLAAGAPA